MHRNKGRDPPQDPFPGFDFPFKKERSFHRLATGAAVSGPRVIIRAWGRGAKTLIRDRIDIQNQDLRGDRTR